MIKTSGKMIDIELAALDNEKVELSDRFSRLIELELVEERRVLFKGTKNEFTVVPGEYIAREWDDAQVKHGRAGRITVLSNKDKPKIEYQHIFPGYF
jgi:hypothetical protein